MFQTVTSEESDINLKNANQILHPSRVIKFKITPRYWQLHLKIEGY